jgi:anti-sigma factor RsiW
MNEHADIRELLPLAAAGALDDAGQKQVEDHLRQCHECRVELESWQRLTDGLRAMPTPQAPLGLVERTRRVLESQAAGQAEQRQTRWMLLWLTLFAWLSTFLTWPLFRLFGDRVGGFLDMSWTDTGITQAWLSYMVVVWMATAIVAALLGKARRQEGRTV